MIFELINPSDKCTFEAPNLKIAALVTCVLGNGQYCAKGIENDLDVVDKSRDHGPKLTTSTCWL
ncbi:hypothetical protein VPJ54_17735, partial [Acinetobacter baumannii]